MAYIIDRYINPQSGHAVITTASVRSDGLYHLDNLLALIYYPYNEQPRTTDYFGDLISVYGRERVTSNEGHVQPPIQEPLTRQQIAGGCMNRYTAGDVGLDPITQLHVKLGHASEKVIKWTVKHDCTMGLRYCYDQIKHAKLGF